jgi:hypothetical protein
MVTCLACLSQVLINIRTQKLQSFYFPELKQKRGLPTCHELDCIFFYFFLNAAHKKYAPLVKSHALTGLQTANSNNFACSDLDF